MKNIQRAFTSLMFVFATLLATACAHHSSPVRQVAKTSAAAAHFNVPEPGQPALGGYDVVSYFKDPAPRRGSEEFSIVHDGIRYEFASRESRDSFTAEPARYLPAYGGWCASAMAFGRKVEIEPTNYIVEEGRLFLFYKGIRGDAKKDWLENQPQWLDDADREWSKLTGHAVPAAASTLRSASESRPALDHYLLPKDSNLALQGYDPVSYFEPTGPLAGTEEWMADHRGVRYHFASEANRLKFLADPAHYEPAYGGWCASAMAFDVKKAIDPMNYVVQDGRLFLFYKGPLGDGRPDWIKNQPKWRGDADGNWERLTGEVSPVSNALPSGA